MLDPKKQLNITLTEPLVFLRTSDPSGRLQSDPNDPPTLVRGILTLNVAKPIGISSIEAELTGVLTFNYIEGIGPRRIELPEKQKIYSSTVTVFRADQVLRGRHSISVGPGLSATQSNEDGHVPAGSSRLSPLPRGRSEHRSTAGVPFGLGPTPPYTVTQPPTSNQSMLGAQGECPARTLEELRQALRENLVGQAGSIPPSSHPHIALCLPNPTIHSVAPNTSNDSLHGENDSHSDYLVHTNSPLESDTSFYNIPEEPSHVLPYRGPSPSRSFRSHSPEVTHGTQPRNPSSTHDPLNAHGNHSRLRLSLTSVLDTVREITSRAPSRSRSVAGFEERERGRSRFRAVAEEHGRESILELGEGVAGPGNGSQLGPGASHQGGHMEHHLLGLGHVLGLERDHEKEKDGEYKSKEHGESWREFKPGTYSYPISFLLPPHLPPTFSLPNGSLNYVIKGVAHRPGTFTSKLSCQVPLLVVASPAIGTGEGTGAGDPGPLFVQRQWQGKLAYSFGLSSRLFLLGSQHRLGAAASEGVRASTESLVEIGVETRTEAVYGLATLDLTLLPIEKVKIWRLDVVIDQRIRFVDERGRALRDDERKQVRLVEVQDTCLAEETDLMEEEQTHKNKHKHKSESTRIPLLPTPISPHRSPLLRYLPPSADPSILAGPGPYTLSTNIGLPGCNNPSSGDSGPLHFTLRQKCSNVKVEHSLRVVLRVESVGDKDTNDHEGEKKKLFDIAVQTPITILSCRCVPEYQMLPRYSQITEDTSQNDAACPCQGGIVERQGHEVGNHVGPVMTLSSASSFENMNRTADEQRNGRERSRSLSPTGRSTHANPLTLSPRSHPSSPASWAVRETGWNMSPSHVQTHSHAHSHSQSYFVSTTHVRAHSQTPPFSTPHTSRPPSPLARYERLVSGLESEAGEAPPSYESVASGP